MGVGQLVYMVQMYIPFFVGIGMMQQIVNRYSSSLNVNKPTCFSFQFLLHDGSANSSIIMHLLMDFRDQIFPLGSVIYQMKAYVYNRTE